MTQEDLAMQIKGLVIHVATKEEMDKVDKIIYEKTQKTAYNTTKLIDTGNYKTTAYGTMAYYKCVVCGYDEILDADNFCPHCGRKIIE